MPSNSDTGQTDEPTQHRTTPVLPVPPVIVGSLSQRRALAVSAFLSCLALLWLSLPVGSGLFLGTLLAFSLLRVHERLARRLRSHNLSAVSLALASAVAIIGGLVVLSYFVIARGTVAANGLVHAFEPGGPLRDVMTRLQATTDASLLGPIDLGARLKEGAAAAATWLTSWAAALAGLTLRLALLLFFTIMAAFFVLRHWTEIIARAERMLPLHPAHTRVVLAEFQKVGGEVFIGTLLTGLAQGVLAAVGYVIADLPEAALLGALTGISSLIPVIGTLLIWVPAGVVLVIMGNVGAGIFVLIWGAMIVGVLCDYVIRPKLVGGTGHVPTLITFVALFGGVEVFGLVGLIVGPVIASVALALLQTYDAALCRAAERDGSQLLRDQTEATERQLLGPQ